MDPYKTGLGEVAMAAIDSLTHSKCKRPGQLSLVAERAHHKSTLMNFDSWGMISSWRGRYGRIDIGTVRETSLDIARPHAPHKASRERANAGELRVRWGRRAFPRNITTDGMIWIGADSR